MANKSMQRVAHKFQLMSNKVKEKVTGQVVYSTPYAIYVHENRFMNHPNGGKAKYLEDPARRLMPQMKALAIVHYKRNGNLEGGIVSACHYLLEQSQLEVPVDTGALKASGRVEVDVK